MTQSLFQKVGILIMLLPNIDNFTKHLYVSGECYPRMHCNKLSEQKMNNYMNSFIILNTEKFG